ncbi:prolyl oligopeptidase family serine peptidase [Tumidithrix elongata RA019]|uniref:Prolyl oligopeptidase family serine peptidase n=1 Tax=Tumidithrix elongata BACA0141 TaxID=2716417 RepID=A0AAW9PV61_9CYAN|nr:prolyl oligopeptidase family serine peptidase [Tumidithrix elongata RA019]
MTIEHRSYNTANGVLPYLFSPATNVSASAPLVLFLHGGRDRGTDLNTLLTWGLPRFVNELNSLPYVFVAPQILEEQTWIDRASDVIALLEHLLTSHSINPSRAIVAGFSLGSAGAWHLATSYPDRFAGVVAVSGRVPQTLSKSELAQLKDIPIQIFQGRQDKNLPVKDTEQFVAILRRLGVHVDFTVLPEGNHFIADEVYGSSELQRWLVSQTRHKQALAV